MEIYRTLAEIPPAARGCVVAVGNFDGVHGGHAALIAAARQMADRAGVALAVLTFEPHPRRLFRPDDPPFRLTDDATRAALLAGLGVDHLYCLTFDWDFASLSAGDFIDRVLGAGLDAAHVVVGADFCFGQLRRGTAQTLIDSGIAVTVIDKVGDEDGPLSSSAVRQALRAGDMARATRILGHPWDMNGVVQVGDRRGRELGYPTANVPLGDFLHPGYGVYAAWVKIADDGADAAWMMAATNIGIRPMFALPVGQIEAHILDFSRDIYGHRLCVRPVQKLRGEAKFDSLDALIAQIGQDCLRVRAILSQAEP